MTKGKRGLVMEVNLNQVVLLTPTGNFVSVKLKKGEVAPSIGQEYFINPKQKFNYQKIARYATLVAVLIVFALLPSTKTMFPLSYNSSPQLEAYLVIDINPSLELGLDHNHHVRTASALNQDGEIILRNEDIVGVPVEIALNKILAAAIKLGYLARENASQNLLITYVPLKTKDVLKIKDQLAVEIENSLVEEKVTANVETVVANENMRELAQDIGLSTGKYAVLLGAREKGLDISPEEMQRENLTSVVKKCGTNLDQLLEAAQNHLKESQKNITKKDNLPEKSVKDKKQVDSPKSIKNYKFKSQDLDIIPNMFMKDAHGQKHLDAETRKETREKRKRENKREDNTKSAKDKKDRAEIRKRSQDKKANRNINKDRVRGNIKNFPSYKKHFKQDKVKRKLQENVNKVTKLGEKFVKVGF